MEILQGDIIQQKRFHNLVVSVGSFDGLHRGHRLVLSRLTKIAKEKNAASLVLTFEPHPRLVLDDASDKIKLLSNIQEKKILFEKIGIDYLLIYPFTKEFAATNAKDFVVDFLYKKLGMKSLVLGFDHFFGEKRSGNRFLLESLAKEYAFDYHCVEELNEGGEKISSTKIRKAIMQGEMEIASRYLGHPYIIYGKVISGYQRGRTLGFPTANLEIPNAHKLLPPDGVYAVNVLFNNKWMGGMMNLGVKPTFSEKKEKTMEIHIFDLDKKIYGETLTIALFNKIREEKAFSSVEELKNQLQKDKEYCLQIFRKEKMDEY